MSLENQLEQLAITQQLRAVNTEKSLLDKLFAKEDIKRINEIHTKETVTKENMQELLQLLVGAELKLLNFSPEYPYILGRYFVRIRESFSAYFFMCDYYNQIKKYITTETTREIWDSNLYNLKETCLFYSSNFQWIERSSMSLEGSAFYNALTNRFEFSYPHAMGSQPQEKKGILGGFLNG